MFKRILVANRGEIALRVMRAARELGVETVAVYSKVDAGAAHVRYADSAVCIGPAPAAKSYLCVPNVIAAAANSGAEAVHPGYGFLAERADFARACEERGIAFVGPSAECIDLMGDKARAREVMASCGVPTVPGSPGPVADLEEARGVCARIGYPVLVKASAGGGGKGMREVWAPEELEGSLMAAGAEAQAAFGNGELYVEKLVGRPRHVEVQVLADSHGNRAALCERDCSIQRRHQKLVEEAPSPALDGALRRSMASSALRALRAVGYRNAGTVEFLLSEGGEYYFMEMNTRVQVEHPVTEEITGVDIVKEQIRIAAGEPMSCARAARFEPNGHAMEFRVNAEDPGDGFRPCPGTIARMELPGGPGVRVETAVREGDAVSPYYDSMIAKVVVWGADREEALQRARRALGEFEIGGVRTTLPLLRKIAGSEAFASGDIRTDFLEAAGILG